MGAQPQQTAHGITEWSVLALACGVACSMELALLLAMVEEGKCRAGAGSLLIVYKHSGLA